MRGVPDRLLESQFRRLDPLGHQSAAGRIPHALGVSVDEPQRPDEDHQTHRGFAFGIQEMEETVHLGTQADEQVDHCRQQQARGHHFPAAYPVGQEAVDKPGHPVDDSVHGQEEAQPGFADTQFRFQGRHHDAEIFPHEIEEGIADHQQDERAPLPIGIFLLDGLFLEVLFHIPKTKF